MRRTAMLSIDRFRVFAAVEDWPSPTEERPGICLEVTTLKNVENRVFGILEIRI